MALLSSIPWRSSPRPRCEGRAPVDYLLQPLFALSYLYMSFTLVRIFCAAALVPAYMLLAFYRSILPFAIRTGTLLLTPEGRTKLEHDGARASVEREVRAQQQLRGDYLFGGKDFEGGFHRPRSQTRPMPGLAADNECMEVCGLRVNVVHKRPAGSTKGTFVLLHGNPSWSFMYRHIIPLLASQGYEVLALDWIGFGGSDKPLKAEAISFELHMHTLLALLQAYQLEEVHILAHDWGGCVALSTILQLARPGTCKSLMLLNSFFAPRPSDVTLNAYSLYLLWLCAQGLLHGFVPEEAIIRFLAPSVTEAIASGYAAPFPTVQSKAAVTRFARMVPGLPQLVYTFFESKIGRMLDGMCPPESFSSLHEQSRLRKRDEEVRAFWGSSKASTRVAVLFGNRDSLLGDFYGTLCNVTSTAHGGPDCHILEGAGHYAAEERPEDIAQIAGKFASLEA